MRISSTRNQLSVSALREKLFAQRTYSTEFLRQTVRRLSTPVYARKPTIEQKRLLFTSFMLGCASIPMAIFPVCSLPVAITGLLLGLYGRRTTTLTLMASWTIVLSLIGLLLTCINIIFLCSIYFGSYMWQR